MKSTYHRLLSILAPAGRVTLLSLMVLRVNTAGAADLSPAAWPTEERERLEKIESQTWAPTETTVVTGSGGMISAMVSPIAVYAGLQTLKQGGSAADAAAATALTEVTTELGSVVSYAGVFTMVYYDAKTKRVSSLDAGYNSYAGETDPLTIPNADLGALNFGRKEGEGTDRGRETLVPGFMAGIEAMHQKFGKLPFRDLFEAAIWYDEHGVVVSPILDSFFAMREKAFSRTPEGKRFLQQSGAARPKTGDRFVQPELAATLRAVANQGAAYMYTGDWGRRFLELVKRDGGKVTAEDLARYRPSWTEPQMTEVFGYKVYSNGTPQLGAYALSVGLHLAEVLKLGSKRAYWEDSAAFADLSRIQALAANAPRVEAAEFLKARNIDFSPAAQLTPAYAASIAPFLPQMVSGSADNGPHHSNGIVVVDAEGNIAAITHTINAVTWGDSGIVVGGIPLPDSAGFQQAALAVIKAGDRVPNPIIDTICFDGDKPVLATASIGASLAAETLRVIVGSLAQHQSLSSIMAAPPLLTTFDQSKQPKSLAERPITIPTGAYPAEFVRELQAGGLKISEVPVAMSGVMRGTVAAVAIDGKSGTRTAVNQTGIIVFSRSE